VPSDPPAARATGGDWMRLAALAVGLGAILSYHAAGRAFYAGFHVPQGTGMTHLLPEELAHIALFSAFGLAAVAGLTIALVATSVAERSAEALRALTDHGLAVAWITAIGMTAATWWIGATHLGHSVTTDDEHVYRFIAQTLRGGALVAPSPGADLDFFREQFVVLTDTARYGKYPIGHPLLLALGQWAGLETLVVPLTVGFLAVSVYALASRVFSPGVGVASLLLLATSPQVLLTGATFLSQPLSALCLVGGLLALWNGLVPEIRGGWLALAGAVLGYGLLVRPLPGALFVLVAAILLAVRLLRVRGLWPSLRPLAAFTAGPLAAVLLWLALNRMQSGSSLTTGYQTFHATGGGSAGALQMLGGSLAEIGMSLVSAGLRLSVWLLGWPMAPLLCLAAFGDGRGRWLWAMVGAEVAYRVIAPKAGVGATGPLYLFEVVPLLVVLAAAGLVRLSRSSARARSAAVALVLAGLAVDLTMFLPVKLADLRDMGAAQRAPETLLHAQGVHHALVFHDGVVPWWTRRSWAYYPRCNSPALDDDVLFLHLHGPAPLEAARELWRRRFPDRGAWLFSYIDGRPRLLPLDQAMPTAEPRMPPL